LAEVASWGDGRPDFSDNVSGDYVNITSGINLQVDISGDPVTIQSGAGVLVQSGYGVIINSGVGVTTQSGVFTASGAFVKTVVIDTAGDEAKIDATANAMETITYPHHEIHEGHMWHGFAQTSGLADDAVLDMLIVTASGKEVHAVFEHDCAGDSWFELYENYNLSGSPGGSGALVTPHCMNRYVSGTPGTTIYKNPSGIGGTKLSVEFIGGGTGRRTAGGSERGANEWILTGVSGPVNYVARMVNVAGSAKDSSAGLEFYEKNPGY